MIVFFFMPMTLLSKQKERDPQRRDHSDRIVQDDRRPNVRNLLRSCVIYEMKWKEISFTEENVIY